MNGDKQQPDLFTLVLTSVGAEITAFKLKTRKICNEDDDSLTDSITQRVMNTINEYNGSLLSPQKPKAMSNIPDETKNKKEEIRNLLYKKAKEQYNNSGSFSASPFGLDGIPFVRRDAIVDFCYDILESELQSKDQSLQEAAKEIERLKVLIELSHKAILSEQSEEEYDPAAYGRWYDAYQQFKTENNL